MVSKKMLRSFIKEEKETSKLYKKLGFKKQASQELEHSKFFTKKLKEL